MKNIGTVKRAAIALAIVTAIGALAGCTPASDSNTASTGPVTITFWDNNGGPSRTPIYQELIKRFEKANPKITVNYVGIPAADAQQKYETAVAGGSGPDVGVINSTAGLSGLVAQGALEPLDKLLASSSLNGHIAADALKGSKGASPDGKLYVMPATTNADVIWYNSTLFKAKGLSAPQTWADFYSDAAALTDKSKGEYGFAMRGGAGGIAPLVSQMFACSGTTTFFDSSGKSTLDSPANVACLKQFAGLYNVDTSKADLNYAYPDMIGAFDKGADAMVQHNLGSAAGHVTALGAGVAIAVPMPASDSTGKRTLIASSTDGPAIFASSKQKAADWKFIEFLLSHESNSYWNQNAGQIPTNTDARSDAWVAAAPQVSSAIAALSDTNTTIVPPPTYLPDWGSITNDLTPDFQSVLLGKTTAEDFAKKFADEVTASYADFKKNNK